MWSFGKKYGYVTQIQFFRDRFESKALGYLMFPILVGLIIPYLLVGLMGAGNYIFGVTRGMFPGTFAAGAVPAWLSGLVICCVVLFYVFFRGTLRCLGEYLPDDRLHGHGLGRVFSDCGHSGGLSEASAKALEHAPEKLQREGLMTVPHFISYMLVPLSVGMFPHLFQHWLDSQECQVISTDSHRPSDLHHDRLGAVHPDRHLGCRPHMQPGSLQCHRCPTATRIQTQS